MMHSKTFTIGFLCGIALFIAINVYSYSQAIAPCCNLSASFGVPFTAGSRGNATDILLSGVMANMIVAVIASYLLSWVAEKIFISRHRLS